MNKDHEQYTFTFDKSEQTRFSGIKSRLDPDEYVVVEDIRPHKDNELTTIMEMEPLAASTFRFGMGQVTIKRLLSPEEEAEKKANKERNTITISVKTFTDKDTDAKG